MTFSIRSRFVAVLAAAAALSGVAAAANAAFVANFGSDGLTCEAYCGIPEDPCVADGKLTAVVTSSGVTLFTCTDADWILDPPAKTEHVDIDCGDWGFGTARITPSGKVNFTCHPA